ncbi:unnamed protein product [Haemonchus placei]|uniref:Uncharacterized protein n=1 Tax=Haemonchus placei TaxID=6290 RepID=A0A3P7XC27_HAEPC|nr:unnamed protein product [Haemonchus placei]
MPKVISEEALTTATSNDALECADCLKDHRSVQRFAWFTGPIEKVP